MFWLFAAGHVPNLQGFPPLENGLVKPTSSGVVRSKPGWMLLSNGMAGHLLRSPAIAVKGKGEFADVGRVYSQVTLI